MRWGESLRLVFAVLLVLLIAGAALLSGSPGDEVRGSVFSVAPEGRRAAYRLLSELGFDARPWTAAPGRLGAEDLPPPTGSVLWLAGVPPEPLARGKGPPVPEGEVAPDAGMRDRRNYLRYVERGGTLVVHADPDLWDFLEEALEVAPLAKLREAIESDDGERTSQRAWLPSSEELELAWPLWPAPDPAWTELEPGVRFETVLADEGERPVACSIELDRGRIVLLSPEQDPLRNGAIDEGDNALVLVRLCELYAPRGTVLFDEYALGSWAPRTPLELAFSGRSWVFALHLCALGILLAWRSAWPRAFPRDPEPLESHSPRIRARSIAGLLSARRRFDLLSESLRLGVLRRLSRRAGRRLEGEPGREAIEAELADLAHTGWRPEEREEAGDAFLGEPPTTREGFELLAGRLAALEASHAPGNRRTGARGPR